MADNDDNRYRRTELWALWIQATASVLACVVAIAGGIVAYLAFNSQRQVIAEQQDLAREQQEQDSRRNADLVAYWDEWDDGNGTVITRLQNRSAAPLRHVHLLNFSLGGPPLAERRRFGGYFLLSVVPPCSTIAITLDAAALEHVAWNVGGVLFSDPIGAWVKSDAGTRAIDDALVEQDGPIDLAPATDRDATYYDHARGTRMLPARLERETSCG
ncbi:hypothetical protein [Micromonospora sp. NPDC004704]